MNSTAIFAEMTTVDVIILGWQVALFFVTVAILVSLGRTKLSLIAIYLFTLFWGFYFYWGSYIASAGASLVPLIIYAGCGLAHVVLTIIALYQSDKKPSISRETLQ